MIHRHINILLTHTFFLFGARGTGKTTHLKTLLQGSERVRWINLLDASVHDRYLTDPDLLRREVLEDTTLEWVVIDEVQKIPRLLDVVHDLIESTKVKWALSGSSAKKLRAGGANLLAGRAFVYNLFPFTHRELGTQFVLDAALAWGTLPPLLVLRSDEERERFLESYCLTYLREEVWNEHLVRALEPFRRFLEVAAQSSGAILNFASVARDVGVDQKTIRAYFSILEETLLGFFLEPYHRSVRKRQRSSPKFYLFDNGVIRAFEKTLQIPISERTYGYGRLFEHFIMQEMQRLNEYARTKYSFYYLQSGAGAEVDLVIERPGKPLALVELKSTARVTEADVRTLEAFQPDFPNAELFCLSRDSHAQAFGAIRALPWEQGLRELGLLPGGKR